MVPRMDQEVRAEFSRLRTEMRELELRTLDRDVGLAWKWVLTIVLASLALAATLA